jgi:hypothetical protein
MFNLIVAVISIALIAAMAVASIYYGGDSFGRSSARAQAATLISQAQQISGAAGIYMIENSSVRISSMEPDCSINEIASACAINRLVDGQYLTAKPVVPIQIVTPLELLELPPGNTLQVWTQIWTISKDGTVASVWLNSDVQAAICEEVERQGGADRTTIDGFSDVEDFKFDATTSAYRCADLDIGPTIITVFGYRL